MAKKRYSSSKYDQFFYRGDNLSDPRKKWNKEMERLLNRAGDWVRKFHAVVDVPTKPDRATAKAINRIKEMVWKNIDEATKKQYRKEYEYKYENKIPEVYKPKPVYTPPTEQDFYNNITLEELEHERQFVDDNLYEEPDEDGYTETVDSRAEIEAWIDRNIYAITVERENEGAKEKLERLVIEAADQYGDDASYYIHLENNATRLNQLAEQVVKYHRKGSYGYQEELVALTEFATILNLGRPLSPHESERLENEGWVGFDFND